MRHAGVAAVAGALIAVVLGLLTVGVQASAGPHGLPVAIAAPEAGPLRAAAERLAGQRGEGLNWRVTTPEQGRKLLDDKEVYGVLELGQPATVVVSGAVNPAGTQVAQQALTAAGQAVTKAPATVETVHPASAAGRTAPLAVSILAWLGSRSGSPPRACAACCRACPPRPTSPPASGCWARCSPPVWSCCCGRGGQPARKLRRTRRTGLSTLVSTRQTDCQVPRTSVPPSTGTLA